MYFERKRYIVLTKKIYPLQELSSLLDIALVNRRERIERDEKSYRSRRET